MDPIDSNRNLGAAISTESVGRFVLVSRAFLKKPSISFFKPKKKPKRKPNDLRKNVLVLSFRYKQRSPDIIWGQLKRATTSIATQIEEGGFSVLRKTAVISKDDAVLLFLLQSTKLEQNLHRVGPDFYTAEHVERFISSNKKKSVTMWLNEQGKVCSIQKRPQTDVMVFLKDLIRKNLDRVGVPAGLKGDIKTFKLVLGHKITSKSIKEAISELVSTDETIFSS
jgi:tRNA nucleotidyltransferase (CCA-adding enzyme)